MSTPRLPRDVLATPREAAFAEWLSVVCPRGHLCPGHPDVELLREAYDFMDEWEDPRADGADK